MSETTAAPDGRLQAIFANATSEQANIAQGFSNLAHVAEPALLTGYYVSRLVDPRWPLPSFTDTVAAVKVSASELPSIVKAMSVLTAAMYPLKSPPTIQEFLDEAVRHGFLKNEDRDGVASFFTEHLAKHHDDIRATLVREKSAMRVVPSFRAVDATTDIRVRYDGDNPVLIPMALVLLATDVDERSLVFQMTLRDATVIRQRLDGVIETLEKLRNMRLENEPSNA